MPAGREGISRVGGGVVDGGKTGVWGMRKTWNASVEESQCLFALLYIFTFIYSATEPVVI